jgi:hypothetical protein
MRETIMRPGRVRSLVRPNLELNQAEVAETRQCCPCTEAVRRSNYRSYHLRADCTRNFAAVSEDFR